MPRLLLFLWLLLGGWAALAGEAAALPISEDDVAVDYREGAYFGRLSFRVAVPTGVAIQVLTDFDHMAEFVPNLLSSHTLARTGNVYRIAQQGQAKFGPFTFPFESERRIELMPDGRLISLALSGSAKSMRSELSVQATATGTQVDYQIEMVPGRWLPSTIGVGFMRHELAEQFTAMMREMERRHARRLPH